MRIAAGAAAAAAALAVAAVALAAPPAPVQWCGKTSAVDRPDALSALQVHVVYAVPRGAPDAFEARVGPILADLAAIEAWWRRQDPTRAPRLDVLRRSCATDAGRVDLTDVRLPHGASWYAEPRRGYSRLADDLETAPLSLRSPDKKYLVYVEAAAPALGVCGASPLGDARAGGTAFVYLGSECAADLGAAGAAAATAAHELLHNLGARPRAHPCVGTPSHACDDERDLLYYAVEGGVPLSRLRLDVGRDDYYGLRSGRGGTDVRDSPFLERLGEAEAAAPLPAPALAASSGGRSVTLSWRAPSIPAGALWRVYRDGALLLETGSGRATDRTPRATAVYAVRAVDAAGRLGPASTISVRLRSGQRAPRARQVSASPRFR